MAILKKKVSRLFKDFDLAFNINATTGDIGKKVDVNAVKQSLKNLILTRPYERPFDPNIGTQIYGMLFEPMDMLIANQMKILIGQIIDNYEPRVVPQEIHCDPDYDQNEYNVTLHFRIVGFDTPQVLKTTLKRVR